MLDAVAAGEDLVQDPKRIPKCGSNRAIALSNLRLLGGHRKFSFAPKRPRPINLKLPPRERFERLEAGNRMELPCEDSQSEMASFTTHPNSLLPDKTMA
jgi:hypothetical protein